MAALTTEGRQNVMRTFAERISARNEPVAINKHDLQAVVNAIDDWISANAASFNNALPQPGRGALTTAQKSELHGLVSAERFEGGVS